MRGAQSAKGREQLGTTFAFPIHAYEENVFRPNTTITMRIPVNVVDSLKAIAPNRGFSGYPALLKSYISEGLRRDEAESINTPLESLRMP